MSVSQNLNADHAPEAPPPGYSSRQVRIEDVLRGLLIGLIVIAGGLFLGSFTQQEIIGRGTPYFVLAAGLGVLLTALAYRKIEWVMMAYIAVIWLAVGATPDLVTGTSSGAGRAVSLTQIGLSFLLCIWFLRGAAHRQFSFTRLPLNGLLISYLTWNVLCAVNGRLFWDPAVAHYWGPPDGGRTPLLVVVFEVIMRFLSVAAFWLFANNLREAVWVRRASWLLLLPGGMVFLIYITHLPLHTAGYSPLLEILFACTVFAWLLEALPPAARPHPGLRFLGWLLLAAVVYQLFRLNLNWVSGWFGLFVGLYYVAFLRSRRLFAVLAVVGLIVYVASQAFLQATVVQKVQKGGDLDRFSMARAAVLYAVHFPIGIGPGNYKAYNLFYGLRPEVTEGKGWGTTAYTSSHGFYSQMLAETGFIGLILTVLFVGTALVMVSRFYWRLPPGPSRTFVLGLAGMWAGICGATGLGDYLIPVYYNNGVNTMGSTIYAWIGLGVAVAHARLHGLVRDEKPQPAASTAAQDAAATYPLRMGEEAMAYPRRMGGEDSYYPRRMGRKRDSA